MPTKLNDRRESAIQTLEEAAALFNEIASTEIKMARAKAMAEARIAKIKELFAAKMEEIIPELEDKREALSDFIDTHEELFEKPRKQKTDFGTFGLHKACKVKFLDKPAALDFVVDQGMTDCFKSENKLIVDGVKDVLLAGRKITGTKLLKGDIAHYTVKKALITEAKQTD